VAGNAGHADDDRRGRISSGPLTRV
jgi:hypothetical protein